MEPPESSPPHPLPEGEGKEEVKEADELKLDVAKETATETSDMESPMAAQRRLTEGEGELEVEEHQQGDRMTTESLFGCLFEQEGDRENQYYAKSLDAESSTAAQRRLNEGAIEVLQGDVRMAIRESPQEGNPFYHKTSAALDVESPMADQRQLVSEGFFHNFRKKVVRVCLLCRTGEEEKSHKTTAAMMSRGESAAMMSSTESPSEWDPVNIIYKCALYRVHSNLRDGSDKHYEPVLVSIGPYHHGKPALKGMEKHKEHFMEVLLERVNRDGYVDALKNEEVKIALLCYWDTHQMNDDSFGKCMVRDGFFLTELFRGTWTEDQRSVMLFNGSWMMPLLERDMLLFENQIPLFVLRSLFALTDQTHNEYDHAEVLSPSREERHDSDREFVKQALEFFDCNHIPLPNLNLQPSQLDHIPHLLGLVYEALVVSSKRIDSEPETPKQQNYGRWKSLLESSMINLWSPFVRIVKALVPKTQEQCNNGQKSWEAIWTAMALEQVGVQFRPAKDHVAFYDIHFNNGVLSIPPLVIDDSTESFFRNLVAYEQHSKYYTHQQVGSYLKVMDCLINSAKDVELLRHCRIIDNGLGDDEKVSTMFNHIRSGVCYYSETFYYADMFNEVNTFCKKRRNVWITKLKKKYFGSPWSVISFVAALLLLLLTAFQTGYSAASYYNQPKSQG